MDTAVTPACWTRRWCSSRPAAQAGRAAAPVIPIGALARYDRPAPSLAGYDELLTGSSPMTARVSDTAAQAAIGAAARELHLPTVRAEATRLAELAVRERQTHLGFLAEVLSRRGRRPRRTAPRPPHRRSQVPPPQTARRLQPRRRRRPSPPATLATLASGAYIDAGEPVVLLGDCGTGKTHLLIGLGLAACEQGRRVRYVTTAAAGQRARRSRRRTATVPRGRPLRTAGPAAASTSWATSRSTPAAPSCCSRSSPNEKNAPRSRRRPTCRSASGAPSFPDPRLVAAIVDRVTFNAHILETGTQSYRLRTSKNTRRGNKAS